MCNFKKRVFYISLLISSLVVGSSYASEKGCENYVPRRMSLETLDDYNCRYDSWLANMRKIKQKRRDEARSGKYPKNQPLHLDSWVTAYKEESYDKHNTYIPATVFLDWCISLFTSMKEYEDSKKEHIIELKINALHMKVTNTNEKGSRHFWKRKWMPCIDFDSLRFSSSSELDTQYHVLAKFLFYCILPFVHNDYSIQDSYFGTPPEKSKLANTHSLLCLIINRSEGYRKIEEIIDKLKFLQTNVFSQSIKDDFFALPAEHRLEPLSASSLWDIKKLLKMEVC